MKRIAIIVLLTTLLGGCASVPLATGLAVGSLGVAGAALAVNAFHNCRADGGCKAAPLPK